MDPKQDENGVEYPDAETSALEAEAIEAKKVIGTLVDALMTTSRTLARLVAKLDSITGR